MRRPRENYDPGDGIGPDPHRDQPRPASKRETAAHLDNICLAVNFIHGQVSALRHELAVDARPVAKRKRE